MTDKEGDRCEVFCSDLKKVNRVREKIGSLEVMVDIFKALADETRFKIIYALWVEEELCVCDLALVIGMPVAATSYHLRYLRSLRLVRFTKRGKMVFYSLDDEHVRDLVKITVKHIEHTEEEKR
ncbi:MAG: metalloregulator ArsR/SmtB family transcription factor [Candidatus Contubernalis sp.]|nr:metalloregulator ArsR/SmtB family transcription factor [Candidatus Contubernalis sp.]